jgi:hypothetical protein
MDYRMKETGPRRGWKAVFKGWFQDSPLTHWQHVSRQTSNTIRWWLFSAQEITAHLVDVSYISLVSEGSSLAIRVLLQYPFFEAFLIPLHFTRP